MNFLKTPLSGTLVFAQLLPPPPLENDPTPFTTSVFMFYWVGVMNWAVPMEKNVKHWALFSIQQFQFQFFTLNLKNSDKTKSQGVDCDRANLD